MHLDSKTVAVESSLQVLVEPGGLEGPVLLLRGEKEAGSIGQGQSFSRSVKKSLLTPALRKVDHQLPVSQ